MTPHERLQVAVPLNALAPEQFDELLRALRLETHESGTLLFRRGDTDTDALYLIEGQVALSSGAKGTERVVSAGSDEARYALAQLKPRQYDGTTRTPVTLARIDGPRLDRLLTMEQATGYEVTEIEGAEDPEWMFHMLRMPAFEKIPPSNFNAMFARMQRLEVKAGDVVVHQGAPGDYYYIIRSGRATVSRRTERTPGANDSAPKVTMLGELNECESFGEEALLSGAPRNATVTMSTDGVLMRLSRSDFDALLKEPLVRWVDEAQARSLVQRGAGLIDVRLEDEHRRGSIKGSLNVPLYLLRIKAQGLDPARPYVVFCDTGSRSCTAAFLLTQRGFDVHVLRGGLGALTRVA